MRSWVIEPPHGEYPNALVELYYFQRRIWVRLFDRLGWDVSLAHGNGLFYTGYSTFPDMTVDTRKRLAKILGSACLVFVLRARP